MTFSNFLKSIGLESLQRALFESDATTIPQKKTTTQSTSGKQTTFQSTTKGQKTPTKMKTVSQPQKNPIQGIDVKTTGFT